MATDNKNETAMIINTLHSLLIDALIHDQKEIAKATSDKLTEYINKL
jgi:hypothetical protein